LSSIRILIASEHALLRQAVSVAFATEGDLSVVAEVDTPSLAVVEARRLEPDVVLIDLGQSDDARFKAVADIRHDHPNCGLLVLVDEEGLPSLVKSLESGATGYIAKTATLDQLVAGTRAVVEGAMVIPPSMIGSLVGSLLQRQREVDGAWMVINRLTRREREVLVLVSEGAHTRDIAQILAISPQTARTHVQNILGKLGVHSRLEAAALTRQSRIQAELDIPAWGRSTWVPDRAPALSGEA
jgi:DNA-binding NarL/FixJ family response regulator